MRGAWYKSWTRNKHLMKDIPGTCYWLFVAQDVLSDSTGAYPERRRSIGSGDNGMS